jgi:hypothetical protein
MKIRLLLALVGLAIGFTVPTFAQQKETGRPKLSRMHLTAKKGRSYMSTVLY